MNNEATMKNGVFRRLKYLVLLQAGEKFRGIKEKPTKKTVFKSFLKVLAAVTVTAVLYLLMSVIRSKFFFTFDKELFTTVLFFTQIVSIVTCIGSMMSVLYNSKENMILMAFPCNYNEIFLSKVIVFTIEEMKKSCFFVLPFLLSYGFISKAGGAYWGGLIPTWIFMTLFPVLFSAILSIPLIFVKKFLENHSAIMAGILIAFLAGAFTLVIFILSKVPTPLRLIAFYRSIMQALRAILIAINRFSLFYAFIGKAMFGIKVWLYLPIVVVIFAATVALCIFVAMPFYFKASSSSAEHSTAGKHRVKTHRHNNLFLTFFRKEVKLMFRSSQNMTSAISIILIFPIISYIMNFIVAAIRTTLYGDYMTVAFILMITLSLLGTYNANCAAAISSEGGEFAVLKAAPSDTKIVTWAKLTLTMLVNLIAVTTMCVVVSMTTTLPARDILFMFVVIVFISLGNILWSFQIDVTNPKVNDYAVKGDAVVDNPNIAKALVIGFLISTVIGVVTLLLLIDGYWSGWIRAVLIAMAYFAIRLYLYSGYLKVYFNDIQG